jgi:hypothetical protein
MRLEGVEEALRMELAREESRDEEIVDLQEDRLIVLSEGALDCPIGGSPIPGRGEPVRTCWGAQSFRGLSSNWPAWAALEDFLLLLDPFTRIDGNRVLCEFSLQSDPPLETLSSSLEATMSAVGTNGLSAPAVPFGSVAPLPTDAFSVSSDLSAI